jgi:hypothetical protein
MAATPAGTPSVTPSATPAWVVRRRRRRILRAVAVLVAVTVLALAWWQRHPRAFSEASGAVGIYSRVGATSILGIGSPGAEPVTVTLRSVEPLAVRDDGATMAAYVCHFPAHRTSHVGAVRGPLEKACPGHEPAEGASMRLGPDSPDQLVLAIASDDPARVRLRGVEVTYTRGWQTGRQRIGPTIVAVFGEVWPPPKGWDGR